ncbi:MAG TPA: ATP-binding protein [Cytophagaceae bacterium]|jgi:signal transduction histidine kinase
MDPSSNNFSGELLSKILSQDKNYAHVLDLLNDGILLVNGAGTIEYANKTFCELSEFDVQSLNGKIITNLLRNVSDDPLLQGAERNFYLKTHSNRNKLVSSKQFVVNSENGDFTIYILKDFTEQKKVEDALEQKNKELNTFIYKVSHDLKGPLTSVIGLINIAKDESKEEVALNYFNLIEKCTQRLDIVLIDLLEVTRLQIGQVEEEHFKMSELMEDVLSNLNEVDNSEIEQVEIKADFPKDLVLYTDKNILTSVIRNLVNNSIKYRKRNIEKPSVKIEVVCDDMIHIKVSDNGIGIEAALHDRVFEMFYRASAYSKGSGLGLYIVKIAVQKLQGTFSIHSAYNEGTSIKINLPINPPQID